MTQPLPLLIGQSDFKAFREFGAYYVDKSLFIQEVLDSAFNVLLLPRPRRFGKTLNLSMLRYFFERHEPGHGDLFAGLAIADTPHFAQHQGRYPVIYLTFKDQKEMTWDALFHRLTNLIRTEFTRREYLLREEVLTRTEKRYIEAILEDRAQPGDYSEALRYLSNYLYRVHGEKVVILLDEYDTPILAGYLHDYYEEVLNFTRNLLSGGLKDNPYLLKGVVTGIQRVAKESIFSSLNNLGVYTLMQTKFNTVFGFTDAEVRTLLDAYGMRDNYAEVSHWYNGYRFGGEVIYNPWSVANYVENREGGKAYWLNTGGMELIERLMTRGGTELRSELDDLLAGRAIVRPVYDSIVLRDLDRRDDLLWSFLLFSGYLNYVALTARWNWYELTIPNQELRAVYVDLVDRWFREKVDLTQLESMLRALRQGDTRHFERLLRQVVLEVMSYHDLSGSPEKVYQALVLGMLVWLAPQYDIRTNRESGYGRYDILLKPKLPGQRGIVLEFKRVYDDQTPEAVLDEALTQINARAYTTELEAAGVTDILRLAIAFRGKEMWLRQGEGTP